MKQEQIQAAEAFVNATIAGLKDERGVHAETAIAATARMAGTFLFRSFGFNSPQVKPGEAVLSEVANEQGPRLVQLLAGVLAQQSINLDEEALGKTPGPDHEPQHPFLATQRRLEPAYTVIKDRHGLSLPEAAESAVIATGLLIHQAAGVLDPNVAFAIGVYGLVEGSKSAPDPVAL